MGDHIRQNVIGVVAPPSGELFSFIVDGVDVEVFQLFLDELAKVAPKKQGVWQVLILDNASWYKAVRFHWRHFGPKFLPGYSPNFNAIKRVRLRLKADWFRDCITRLLDEFTERLCTALTRQRRRRVSVWRPPASFWPRERRCSTPPRRGFEFWECAAAIRQTFLFTAGLSRSKVEV